MIPDDMELIYVETPRPEGPFGAAGVGELPLTSPHAAIINGIYNALRGQDNPAAGSSGKGAGRTEGLRIK